MEKLSITERHERKKTFTAYQLCFIALAAVMNIVGAQIALVLRLPIYLDSIGAIMVGAAMGPIAGLFPSLISGLAMGLTVDIYSLFFMPASMITGLMAGVMFRTKWLKGIRLIVGNLIMALPGTIIGAFVCVAFFGGLTSSGSAFLIPLFRKLGMGEVASITAVQLITDYADRLLAVFLITSFLKVLPQQLKAKLK